MRFSLLCFLMKVAEACMLQMDVQIHVCLREKSTFLTQTEIYF